MALGRMTLVELNQRKDFIFWSTNSLAILISSTFMSQWLHHHCLPQNMVVFSFFFFFQDESSRERNCQWSLQKDAQHWGWAHKHHYITYRIAKVNIILRSITRWVLSEPRVSPLVCSELIWLAWILSRYCPILVPVQMIAWGHVYACGSVISSYPEETGDFCSSTALLL